MIKHDVYKRNVEEKTWEFVLSFSAHADALAYIESQIVVGYTEGDVWYAVDDDPNKPFDYMIDTVINGKGLFTKCDNKKK